MQKMRIVSLPPQKIEVWEGPRPEYAENAENSENADGENAENAENADDWL